MLAALFVFHDRDGVITGHIYLCLLIVEVMAPHSN